MIRIFKSPASGSGCWRGALVCLALVLFLLKASKAGAIRQAVLLGLILLLPSSSIFPANDLAADRRMYLPMICFAPAIALVLNCLPMALRRSRDTCRTQHFAHERLA